MMERPTEDAQPNGAFSNDHEDASPARALTLHLLRMLETRMDAAGIALQGEIQLLQVRLQLKILAGVLVFLAAWGAIVLLAIALPENLRVPVLAGVVAILIIGAVWAHLAGKRKALGDQVGSLRWFLDGLRQDLEVLSRSLAQARAPAPGPAPNATPPPQPDPEQPQTERRTPDDLAA